MLLSQFLIGVYGGYFGAGIGILMLAAYGILGFSNIHQANAIKNLNAMFINGIAAAIFICKGLINWPMALLMAAGAIFGGYAGAGAARRLGQKNVRRLVIFIGLALAAKMLLKVARDLRAARPPWFTAGRRASIAGESVPKGIGAAGFSRDYSFRPHGRSEQSLRRQTVPIPSSERSLPCNRIT